MKIKTRLVSVLSFILQPLLLSQEFFQPLDDLRRLRGYLFRQRREFFAAYRIYRPAALFRIGQEIGIFERFVPSVAENFNSIRRHVRWRSPWPAKLVSRHDQRHPA